MDVLLRSPAPLPDLAKRQIAAALGLVLGDGLALHLMTKVAHWNVAGPTFVMIHVELDVLATLLAMANDKCAERAVTLGALISMNVERVGEVMRLKDYPLTPLGIYEHVREICDRLDVYIAGLAAVIKLATVAEDDATIQRLGTLTEEIQEQAWKLVKFLEPPSAPANPVLVP